MKKCLVLLTAAACIATTTVLAEPPVENTDQLSMIKSHDAKLARNKKHVFDFWRIVFEGGHMDRAAEFMSEEYIQHNPNVQSGRQTFIDLFSKIRKPAPVEPRILVPVINITTEGNIVTVTHVRKVRDRNKPEHIYYITWFDMFRINDKGLIAEHWDSSDLWIEGKPPGAEFFPK